MPPVFALGRVAATREAPLTLKVVSPDGRGIAGVDLSLTFADGSIAEGYTQEDGWSSAESRPPRSVRLAIPMFGLVSPEFPLDPGSGNLFTFVLTPNDLGRVDFQAEPLELGEDRLVMHRGGRSLTYVRETVPIE